MEAPTPTPNRDPMIAHFTFDLHHDPHNPHDSHNHEQTVNPHSSTMGNFENPEYYDTDSTGSDSLNKELQNHRPRKSNQGSQQKKSRQKDYYNDINHGLYSDGGSTRGSTAESTSSI